MAGGQYIDFKPGSNIIVNSFSTGGSDADNGIDSEVKFIDRSLRGWHPLRRR